MPDTMRNTPRSTPAALPSPLNVRPFRWSRWFAFLLVLVGVAPACRSEKNEAAPSAVVPEPGAKDDGKQQGYLAPTGVAAAERPAATSAPHRYAPPSDVGGASKPKGADKKAEASANAFAPNDRGGSGNAGSAGQTAPGIAQPPPQQAAIDPNGRFATTYRPGGGHLAAFESAVARGIIPAGERDLVSDIGARYAPTVDAPKDKAMTVFTELERGKIAPTGGETHLRVTLRSTATKPAARPHLSVHLVLDVSGSMKGDSIKRAREAARALVDKLDAGDDFSLVTFSSEAEVKAVDGPVGSRRDQLKKTIDAIEEGGGTNISKGLELGYAQAKTKTIPEDAVRVVLLLSDGRANAGLLGTPSISKLALDAFQDGIQTSSFGLGEDYDGELMSAIAKEGAGGYYYLRDPEQIAPALTTEMDKRLDPVATAVELRVRLKKGVELLTVYGSKRLTDSEAARVRAQEVAADKQAEKRDKIATDRKEDKEGGLRFFIPAFARDEAHSLLFKVRLPEGVDKKTIADIEIRYKDRVAKKNVADESKIVAVYASSDAESASTQNASVVRTVQGFAAGETLAEAANLVASNNRERAVSLLTEREALLRKAAETLSEPLFLKDADRLARLREHAGKQTGMGDPLVLAMLLETASRGHLR
ncbi:MAG: VWA domain-containing protein [Polyangiaceae bacterium]|nr:VWA domain-containing protein [Polyangiaceae bacterium]